MASVWKTSRGWDTGPGVAEGNTGGRYTTLSSRNGVATIAGSANLMDLAAAALLPAGSASFVLPIMGTARLAKHRSRLMLIIAIAVIAGVYPDRANRLRKTSASASDKLQDTVAELTRLVKASLEATTGVAQRSRAVGPLLLLSGHRSRHDSLMAYEVVPEVRPPIASPQCTPMRRSEICRQRFAAGPTRSPTTVSLSSGITRVT